MPASEEIEVLLQDGLFMNDKCEWKTSLLQQFNVEKVREVRTIWPDVPVVSEHQLNFAAFVAMNFNQTTRRSPMLVREKATIASVARPSSSQMRRTMGVSLFVASVQAPVDETVHQDLISLNQSMREGSYESSLVQKQVINR